MTSSSSSSDTAVDSDPPTSTVPSRVPRRESVKTHLLALLHFLAPWNLALWILSLGYTLYQVLVRLIFTPTYTPLKDGQKPLGRIAIIGSGLTGIASAAHAISHGFDVVIFEEHDSIGGIWARVNSTSSLQLNSVLYRFHPSVMWSKGFPERDEIVGQIRALSDRYNLGPKTRLNTKVEKVTRHKSSTDPREGGHGRWIINDGSDGIFDGIIVAIGTCGSPKRIDFEGQSDFNGTILHSSELDDADLEGKKVVIVGSGASGVEAAELAVSKHAKDIVLLARDDKWIIPRNTIFDIALALQPFGRQMPLSFIFEYLIKTFHYRDQVDKAPTSKGIFQGTPICNDEFLTHCRQGKVTYTRGDTLSFASDGVKINARERGTKPGDKGKEEVVSADVIVLATGFKRPSVDMLPEDLFPTEGERSYERPNLYLQNFCTEDASIVLTNASYHDAIGTVGNWHIGLYARILMLFLLDKRTRPIPTAMKVWVDLIRWVKMTAWGESADNALTFFTYTELVLWVVTFHLFKPSRLLWFPFVMFGFGVHAQEKAEERK